MTEHDSKKSYRVEVKASPTVDAYRLVYVKAADEQDARRQATYVLNPQEVVEDVEEIT